MCWAVFAVSRCERPKLAPLEYFLPRKNRITKKTVPDREFRSVFTRMHAARMHAARTHARTRACKRGTCGTRASLRAGHGPPRPAAPARGAPSAAPTCHACPLAQRAADTCHRCRQLHGAQLECTAPSFGARRGHTQQTLGRRSLSLSRTLPLPDTMQGGNVFVKTRRVCVMRDERTCAGRPETGNAPQLASGGPCPR